ncbi:MAG: hypothetical protein OEV87_12170 [Phycisphaerae bacterium]|nr:hypothetical protein [Phycisphaerae bacterium]
MCEHPEWIPECIELNDYSGNWSDYLDQVYLCFCQSLVHSKAYFRDGYVGVRRIPETDGKGFGFWHCISEGKEEDERTPDLERCKRIKWIRAVIDNYDKPEVDYWTNRRGREICHLVWYKETYLVVIAERKNTSKGKKYYLLKTAYPTFGRRRIEKLRKERDVYHKKTDAAPEDGV